MTFFRVEHPDQKICPWISDRIRLKPHQLVGVYWMVVKACGYLNGGLLADDCGLGKV